MSRSPMLDMISNRVTRLVLSLLVIMAIVSMFVAHREKSEVDARRHTRIAVGATQQLLDVERKADQQAFIATYAEAGGESDTSTPPPISIIPPNLLTTWPEGEKLAKNFDAQRVDTNWSLAVSARIYSRLAELSVPMNAIEVHCRTTMCRLEIVATGLSVLNAWQAYPGLSEQMTVVTLESDPLDNLYAHTFSESSELYSEENSPHFVQMYLVGPESKANPD
jgi:hypothetical protein